jgi:glycosyltransferase involved in cell wall biosynthesis
VKRLLMIAFHFPPFAASSGIQRTLGFARHLPAFGWEPLVLTAHPRAYEHRHSSHVTLPARMVVEPAFALDAARQLSVMGRYPGFAARPDRWISWWLGAVPKGLAMIRKYRPDAIWSTYPIATAHKIACTLQRLSGLPWIADFRDPMAQDHYPSDPKTWKSFRILEEAALRRAARGIFVTSGAKRVYRDRYPDLEESRLVVIENGYDEESFAGLDEETKSAPLVPGARTILHSGIVYPSERDPTHLFRALRSMLDEGRLKPGALCVRLRACGHEDVLKRLIDEHGVKDVVQLMPPIPYREALTEMMRADGLLVLQASNCNEQIPVKLYEYLRCGRPIIGLTDPLGDTAALLRRAGMTSIASLDSADDISKVLSKFTEQLRDGTAATPNTDYVKTPTRKRRTEALVGVLDELT